jgi:predicted ferric reductase
MSPAGSLSAKSRVVLTFLIIVSVLLLLIGGWTIPYRFESFSILYKFGLEKIYLRYGKVIGITIALLIFYQVLLASRFLVFKQVLSAKGRLVLHRFNGIAITILAGVHPLLIKASDNFTPYTFVKKYYPEFLGIGLLCVLLAFSLAAVFRNFLKISYKKWLLWHRLGATLVLLLMPSHILYVSETFKSGLPHRAALIILSLNMLMILRIWLYRIIKKNL